MSKTAVSKSTVPPRARRRRTSRAVPAGTVERAQPRAPRPSPWLRSRAFDLAFFQLSGLAVLLLLVPYLEYGARSVFPIYNFYLIFFGLPHNYLTWATILPSSSRRHFRMEPVMTAGLACLGVSLLIPLTQGQPLSGWCLSLISYWAVWHAYRQHHGICKVYDAIQARRTGDATIFADRKALNLFFGLAVYATLVWAFTHPRVPFQLSDNESFDLVYPRIPLWLYHAYLGVTAAAGAWGLKRAVYDRWRAGRQVPWPQVSLIAIATLSYALPYAVLPLAAMPVAVAIATMYHNVQYFGFVWMFERESSRELEAAAQPLGLPQRLARKGSWKGYFGLAFAYSFAIITAYLCLPHGVGVAFTYFLAFAHYVIDGFIWRRENNRLLPPVLARLAAGGSTA